MRYRLEVRLTAADVGQRVVVRWRRPAGGAPAPGGPAAGGPAPGPPAAGNCGVADVLGTLEAADAVSFAVRGASGELVVIPRDRALAAKTVPPAPRRG